MPSNDNDYFPDPPDVAVLKDIVRFGWMTAEQITHRYFLPPSESAARIAQLCDAGFLKADEGVRPKPIYLPPPRGARCAGIGLPAPDEINRNDVYHDLAVVDLADYLAATEAVQDGHPQREGRSTPTRR